MFAGRAANSNYPSLSLSAGRVGQHGNGDQSQTSGKGPRSRRTSDEMLFISATFAAQYQTVKIVKYKGFFYAAGTGPGNRRVDIP